MISIYVEEMAHRDGVANVIIYLDNKDVVFVAGEQLSGRIEVSASFIIIAIIIAIIIIIIMISSILLYNTTQTFHN
jgi:hypothetical protein